ncbi:MAG: DUF4070 domain-containing protein [Methyloceanibacter sp.]
MGKRANLPVACLALLAALVPEHHEVTLIDENVEDIDFARVARADLVCLTSNDLAKDDELMELMGLANFQSVFIGIESPNEASLIETKKLQNVRPKAGTLLERAHRIQQSGLHVWCGMIVGFDHDDASIFDAMPKFIAEARIANVLVGLLHAIPTTPLYDRLRQAGRLNDDDASDRYGTNVVPLRMSREELRDGFVGVTQAIYVADAYFERLDALFIDGKFAFEVHELPYWEHHRLAWATRALGNYLKFSVVAWRLLRDVDSAALKHKYRRQLARIVRARGFEPHILFVYAIRVAMHYHYAAIASALAKVDAESGVMPDAARSFSRVRRPVPAEAAAS